MTDYKLRIRTLGALSIERNGEVVPGFASRKAEALLVYLACNPRTHAREVLAELLWDDRSQKQSLANLRVILSSLRKEVGRHVDITRTTAAIVPGSALSLDVAELEAATARLRAQGGNLSAELAARLSDAAGQYHGDFLEGFFIPDASGFEAWAARERVRVQRLVVDALLALGNWHLAQGDAAGAARNATRLLEIDSLTEAGQRLLVEALTRAGRRTEAVAQFESHRQLLAEELGVEPEAETKALYEAITTGTLAGTEATGAGTLAALPSDPTPFLGRDADLVALARLLDDPTVPLVTIVGPGGIGKTRLALEAATRAAATFADGAVFVNLAPFSAPEAALPAIAQALQFDLHAGDTREAQAQLLAYLRAKELLLLLDNFEHLAGAAPLLAKIARAAPAVKLLVTSRERLKLQVEQLYPLQGLALAQWETPAEAEQDPLVRLFLYHAYRVRPSFALHPDHLEGLRELFRQVGGMPLAVILAAGWVEVLSPAEIASEIGRNLAFLESATRDAPARHQSMRAVFDGTWARLGAEEQQHYGALSVFRGGFTLAAAGEVAAASPRDLLRLVERSLLTRVKGGRFEQHELLRQFAAEELSRSPQRESAVRGRHSAYYCRYLGERESDLKSARAAEAEAEIAAEFPNIRAAWKWAAENLQEGLLRRCAHALGIYHLRRWLIPEGVALYQIAGEIVWTEDALSPSTRALLLSWQSILLGLTNEAGSTSQAEQLARRALAFLDAAADGEADLRVERALALLGLAGTLAASDRARLDRLEASLALFDELGMPWEMAFVHRQLTGLYNTVGDYRQMEAHDQQALRLYQMAGDAAHSNLLKLDLATGRTWSGQIEVAAVREAVAWFQENGPLRSVVYGRMRLAETLVFAGRFSEALTEALAGAKTESTTSLRISFGSLRGWARLHLGSYRQARQEGELWLAAAREARIHYFVGWNNRVLGCAALALNDLQSAQRYLQESVTRFEAIGRREEPGWALAGLAYVALHQDDAATARRHLVAALRHVPALHHYGPALTALPAAALLLAPRQQAERAVELYALAGQHPFVANSRWFEDVAGRRIATVAETLPPEKVVAAQARGQSRDLWETVEELLQELN